MQSLKDWARRLKKESSALRLALMDSRTPGYARWMGALVLAYTLSPIDLIPDFIPILGILDDLILLPLGLYITVRLIPEPVLELARQKVESGEELETSPNWLVGSLIIVFWLLAVGVAVRYYFIRRL